MTRKSIDEAIRLLAGAGVALAACGRPAPATEVPASASGSPAAPPATDAAWSRTWTVAPGDMAEINLELAAGDTMAATFSTEGAALKWNVHSHEDREAIIHAQGEDAAGELRHTVSKGGMYSFLWVNQGRAPVRLTVELTSGAAKVHSTHPAE